MILIRPFLVFFFYLLCHRALNVCKGCSLKTKKSPHTYIYIFFIYKAHRIMCGKKSSSVGGYWFFLRYFVVVSFFLEAPSATADLYAYNTYKQTYMYLCEIVCYFACFVAGSLYTMHAYIYNGIILYGGARLFRGNFSNESWEYCAPCIQGCAV